MEEAQAAQAAPPVRARAHLLWSHPAHALALGFGSGLAPRAPGTFGTLWAWLSFAVARPWLSDAAWGGLIAAGALLGVWACTVSARALGRSDPSAVVWDEIVAFWLVLWVLGPVGSGWQLAAFGLFRWLDAAKPQPVRWADGLFKAAPDGRIGWRQGLGIMFDDLVAAGMTLLLLALVRRMLPIGGWM